MTESPQAPALLPPPGPAPAPAAVAPAPPAAQAPPLAASAERQAAALLDSTPPQSGEAERAALGCMLLDVKAAATCAKMLRPEDFADPAHRTLFDFLASHREPGETPDLVTTTASLRAAGLLETVGGQAYLVDLSESFGTLANAPAYCGIIRQAAAKREAVQAALTLAREAARPDGDLGKALATFEQRTRRATAPAPPPPLLCSAAEACRLLGIGKSLFYALKSSGRLPAPIRLGRAVRWNRETLIAWCNAGCPSAERFEALTRKDRR